MEVTRSMCMMGFTNVLVGRKLRASTPTLMSSFKVEDWFSGPFSAVTHNYSVLFINQV